MDSNEPDQPSNHRAMGCTDWPRGLFFFFFFFFFLMLNSAEREMFSANEYEYNKNNWPFHIY